MAGAYQFRTAFDNHQILMWIGVDSMERINIALMNGVLEDLSSDSKIVVSQKADDLLQIMNGRLTV